MTETREINALVHVKHGDAQMTFAPCHKPTEARLRQAAPDRDSYCRRNPDSVLRQHDEANALELRFWLPYCRLPF